MRPAGGRGTWILSGSSEGRGGEEVGFSLRVGRRSPLVRVQGCSVGLRASKEDPSPTPPHPKNSWAWGLYRFKGFRVSGFRVLGVR